MAKQTPVDVLVQRHARTRHDAAFSSPYVLPDGREPEMHNDAGDVGDDGFYADQLRWMGWMAHGEAWRTEPEISNERKAVLGACLDRAARPETGFYPFRDVELLRADIEWLLSVCNDGVGPAVWGQPGRPLTGLDLRGANLAHADLRRLPLARTQFALSTLERERLGLTPALAAAAIANLVGTAFDGAHLEGAIFSHAFLNEVSFRNAWLEEAEFDGASLVLADLSMVHAQHTLFIGACLRWARLHEADLRGADLRGSILTGADLRLAALDRAFLGDAVAQEAIFMGASLVGADLEGAHLEDSNLVEIFAMAASFASAHLERSIMVGARLEGANLVDANLQLATLVRAHLEGADCLGAQFHGANVRAAYFKGAHGLDFSGANLDL